MLHRYRSLQLRAVLLLLVAWVLSLAWALTARAQGAGNPEELPAWGTVPSPNGGFDPANRFTDVEVLSPMDVWGVGYSGSFGYPDGPQAMVQHWDGTRWQLVALPDDLPEGDLQAVSASGPDDVWAVGGAGLDSGTLLLHWDGSSWQNMQHPYPYHWHWLYDVVALAPDDVWVVGEAELDYDYRMFILHWDGSTWSDFSINPTASGEKLVALAAAGPDDVWAVGDGGTYAASTAYVMHWDGSAWQQVQDPVIDGFEEINAVSLAPSGEVWVLGRVGEAHEPAVARWDGSTWEMLPLPSIPEVWTEIGHDLVSVAPNEAWVVGRYALNGVFYGLAWRWNGSAWELVETAPSSSSDELYAVDASAPDEIWAVGGGLGTLAERWDGAEWSLVPSANEGTADNTLAAVEALAPDEVWAVGDASGQSLTMRWDGSVWSVVPSPSHTDGTYLEAVGALASDDAWAVGRTGTGGWLNSKTVTMHWDGSAWTLFPSPNPGNELIDELHDVALVASDDVWAVGEHWADVSVSEATVLHWDGSVWSESPNECGGALHGVVALAPDDAWAVGANTSCHWDGSTWTQVPLNDPEGPTTLTSVKALSPTDVWAVGQRTNCAYQTCSSVSVMARWDGGAWSFTPLAVANPEDVVVLAADNAWAVGNSYGHTGIAHWDGSEWETVLSPDPASGGSLYGIAAAGPEHLWAVGGFYENGKHRSLVLDAPSATQGHVVGDTGHVDATIVWFGPVSGSLMTHADSDYAVVALPAGSYTFTASASGCQPQQATVEVLAGQTVRQDFNLCGVPPSPVPTSSPTPTLSTPTATATSEPPTLTPTPTSEPATATPTTEPLPSATPTEGGATATPTTEPLPSATPTEGPPPSATATGEPPTLTPTGTATEEPPLPTLTATATSEPPPPPSATLSPTPEMIVLEPASLQVMQQPDNMSEHNVRLSNMEQAPLVWTSYEGDTGCHDPRDLPWLHIEPDAGTTMPAHPSDLMVYLDTHSVAAGSYTGYLCVLDSTGRIQSMPMSVTVMDARGTGALFLPLVLR